MIGCGGIGLNIVQGCRIAGAANIIAIDIMDSKLEMASQFGATHTINSKDVDLDEAIKEITKGEGVEYAFEAIGVPAAATQAFNITRPRRNNGRGSACTLSVPKFRYRARHFSRRRKLIGCMYGSTRFREHMPKLIDLFLQDRLDLTSLVSRRLKLEDVNEAFRSMKAGEVARSVIEF